jgi:Na+/H+-dicarboxylate symporter
MTFTGKILLAMAAGIVLGVFLNTFGDSLQPITGWLVDGVFNVIGKIFIALLQMMVVPLVLVSLVCGVTSMADMRTMGRVGVKTLALYLCTTAIAIQIS